jgi:hypothetical protein
MKKYLYPISFLFAIILFYIINIQVPEVLQEALDYNHYRLLRALTVILKESKNIFEFNDNFNDYLLSLRKNTPYYCECKAVAENKVLLKTYIEEILESRSLVSKNYDDFIHIHVIYEQLDAYISASRMGKGLFVLIVALISYWFFM